MVKEGFCVDCGGYEDRPHGLGECRSCGHGPMCKNCRREHRQAVAAGMIHY